MSRINSTTENQLITDSKSTITHLIELSKGFASSNIEAEILLDKAGFNLEQKNIHESLLCIAEAYIIAADDTSEFASDNMIFIIAGVVLIILILSTAFILIQIIKPKNK